ncbi:MAG: helix-turn-helix domain-containing protein [Alphaproteobacteria bacterium]|nr:helix-turn-helix domain-containing protein [Alphaproteobacteria bacterium]MDA8001127.1 helix-turn-helix domain-containing protein [Alphaproteobacteria bacterium]
MPSLVKEQILSDSTDAMTALESSQTLEQYAHATRPLTLHIAGAEPGASIKLPASIVALLLKVLKAMATMESVMIVPKNAELSTSQAAEILRVSRPYLVKLLDEEAIPSRKVGTHHRIRMDDLMRYKEADDKRRKKIRERLTRESQHYGDGYFDG